MDRDAIDAIKYALRSNNIIYDLNELSDEECMDNAIKLLNKLGAKSYCEVITKTIDSAINESKNSIYVIDKHSVEKLRSIKAIIRSMYTI